MSLVAIRRLQHIGIPTADLARSCAFYARFGFTEAMLSTFPHPQGTGHVRMLQLGEITLELYEVPAEALEAIRSRGDGHIDHIAFDVEDIDTAFAAVTAAGLTPFEPAPMRLEFWQRGCRYFNIPGPDGERLEFNQIL